MTATMERTMNIVIEKCSPGVQQRIRERLDRAAELRCEEHGQAPVGVIIHGRENGWFDARWTTCCEPLEQQARAIVKERL